MNFLVAFVVFLTAVAAMAVGVMFSRKPITGSCGGLGRIEGIDCGVCERRQECEVKRRKRLLEEEEA